MWAPLTNWIIPLGQMIFGGIGASESARQGREDREEWKRAIQDAMGSWDTMSRSYMDTITPLSQEMMSEYRYWLPQKGIDLLNASNEAADRYDRWHRDVTGRVRDLTDLAAKRGLAAVEHADTEGERRERAADQLYDALERKITGRADRRASEGMSILDRYGDQSRRDIIQDYQSAQNSQLARLARSGLGNSTVVSSMATGLEREKQRALGNLGERVAGLKSQAHQAYTGDALQQASRLGELRAGAVTGAGRERYLATQDALRAMPGLTQDAARIIAGTESSIGIPAMAAASELRRAGLEDRYSSMLDYLDRYSTLRMAPAEALRSMTSGRAQLRLGYGLPPEYIPFGTQMATLLGGVGDRLSANRRPERGGSSTGAALGAAGLQSAGTIASLSALGLMASDKRLKDHIEPCTEGLDVIIGLEPTTWVWRDEGAKGCGLVAQEVEKVFPMAVKTDPASGYKVIDYTAIVAVLINAVKQLAENICDRDED